MEEQALIPKQEVSYRKDSANESPCSSCENFIAPAGCKLVEGTIAATGSCDLYAAADKQAALMTQMFGGANG